MDETFEIDTIVAEALERTDPVERAAYLDRMCGKDTELRRRAEALLATQNQTGADKGGQATVGDSTVAASGSRPAASESSNDETGAFLGDPPPSTQETQGIETAAAARPALARRPAEFSPGQVIGGRYTLLAILGEGGMGTVYRAEQTQPVRRQVALKLIRVGMDSQAVVARFDAERQALALMEHPNIARVFDGGTTEMGQPYFVMEIVEGEPITAYCDRRRLPIKVRLELFVAVCQAVQHAHHKGIIHRDLKPSNILITEIDGRPTPKVIDFGVAKATEFDLTNQNIDDFGAIVGTPMYMSPEQADPSSMDIDTRTDVYALGVVLYELLVGSTPIDPHQLRRGATLEILRIVREVQPPRPSTRLSTAENRPTVAANRGAEPDRLAKSLRGELDWVVMKALEKDRNRRYETVNSLARDVAHYLANEVVEARPPSRGYRVAKFVRRHRLEVIAASLVAIALLVGVIGTSLGMFEADRQKRVAVANWNRSEIQREKAERNFGLARQLILNMGTQINQIAAGQADPRLADLARKNALDQARQQFDQFRAGSPEDESVQFQAASIHRYAGNVSRSLTDYSAAMAAYGNAVQILEGLAESHPEKAHYRSTLALTLRDRSLVEKLLGKLAESASTLDRAAEVAEKTKGAIDESSYTRTLGLIDSDRAYVAYLRGAFADSLRFATRSVEGFDDLLANARSRPPEQSNIADPWFAALALSNQAIARRELGETAAAMTAHDSAVGRMAAIANPNANQDILVIGCELRLERARTGIAVRERWRALADDLAEVARICEGLVTAHPYINFYRERLASSYHLRGVLLTLLGDPTQATVELNKSLKVSRELLDRFGVLSASMLVRARTFLALGKAWAASGKNDQALANWKNAATVFGLALKVDPDNVHHRKGLAEAEQALKQLAK